MLQHLTASFSFDSFFYCIDDMKIWLCTSNLVRLQASCTYMKCLRSPINDRLYSTNIGLPHFVRSSMRVAHTITEVYAFLTDVTFCHDSTSFIHHRHSIFLALRLIFNTHNAYILPEQSINCKQFFYFFLLFLTF